VDGPAIPLDVRAPVGFNQKQGQGGRPAHTPVVELADTAALKAEKASTAHVQAEAMRVRVPSGVPFCGVRVVESWWSGYWGWNLITLRLQVSNEGIWQIDVRRYRDEAIFDYRTEDDARHQLAIWLAEARGDWRRVDPR
jgi:hypothetical protein